MRPPTNANNTRMQRLARPIARDRPDDMPNSSYMQYHNSTQDRYLPIIINLESSNMLDEPTATLLKQLILEENVEIFRLINSHIARAIDEHELCQKLVKLAQQVSGYMERPLSPVPKNKKQLLQFVNSLFRYHFKDKDDIELLNKLIQEENEFVLSCFDVFDSDKDHENLIDSLQRILDKCKSMGFIQQKITPSAFYPPQMLDAHSGWLNQGNSEMYDRQVIFDTPQPMQVYGLSSQMQHKQGSPMNGRPDTSQWNERALIPPQHPQPTPQQPLHARNDPFQAQFQNPARAQSYVKNEPIRQPPPNQRPMMSHIGQNQTPHNQRRRERSQMVGMASHPQFQPKPTTVHNVELIQGYFSSGEDEYYNNPNYKAKGYLKQGYQHSVPKQSKQKFNQYGQPYPNYEPASGEYAMDRPIYSQNFSVKKVNQSQRMHQENQAYSMMNQAPTYGDPYRG